MIYLTDNQWIPHGFDPMKGQREFNHPQLDSKELSISIKEWMYSENRYRIPRSMDPVRVEELTKLAKRDVDRR